MLLAYVGHAFDISFHSSSVHEISQLVHEKNSICNHIIYHSNLCTLSLCSYILETSTQYW